MIPAARLFLLFGYEVMLGSYQLFEIGRKTVFLLFYFVSLILYSLIHCFFEYLVSAEFVFLLNWLTAALASALYAA